MKKIIVPAILSILLLTVASVANGQDAENGSIKGFVFQDTNGDGVCQDSRPLAAVSVMAEQSAGDRQVSVSSAADGSYTLLPPAQGSWRVSVSASGDRYVDVAAGPVDVELSAASGLEKSGVNFCMRRPIDAETFTARQKQNSGRTTVADLPAPAVAVNITELAKESTALLTSPPESIQPEPEVLEQIISEPLQEQAINAAQWLDYVNGIRQMAGVADVSEDVTLTVGAQLHSRYMVVHDRPIAHAEDKKYALYSDAGHIAGANGLIFATSQIQADHQWAFNFFVSGPFHLIPLIDPNLKSVGYGHYNEDIGNFTMAAVLDVRSGLQMPPDENIDYPIQFPADGAETWVLRHSLFEWPNAIPSCPGFDRASGPPVVLLLGDGDITPAVARYEIKENGSPMQVCMLTETNFTSPNPSEQSIGRTILGSRDAIVLIPRTPLAVGAEYAVEIEANGDVHAWTFTTRKSP